VYSREWLIFLDMHYDQYFTTADLSAYNMQTGEVVALGRLACPSTLPVWAGSTRVTDNTLRGFNSQMKPRRSWNRMCIHSRRIRIKSPLPQVSSTRKFCCPGIF
jgi:hypothetical protein